MTFLILLITCSSLFIAFNFWPHRNEPKWSAKEWALVNKYAPSIFSLLLGVMILGFVALSQADRASDLEKQLADTQVVMHQPTQTHSPARSFDGDKDAAMHAYYHGWMAGAEYIVVFMNKINAEGSVKKKNKMIVKFSAEYKALQEKMGNLDFDYRPHGSNEE